MPSLARLPHVFLAAAALFAATASEAAAREIPLEQDLQTNSYWYIELKTSGETAGSDIAGTWETTGPIDLWIVSADNLAKYKAGGPFTAEVTQGGTSGELVFNISALRQAEEPFYVVFDNTATGPTDPPDNPTASVHLSFDGETRMGAYSMGGATNSAAGRAAADLVLYGALSGVAALLVLYLVLRRRKKRRLEEARRRLYAGVPTAAPAQAPEPAAPRLPTAAQVRGKLCPSCGSGVPSGNSFCNNCGTPAGN